jgi:hypothetical protein
MAEAFVAVFALAAMYEDVAAISAFLSAAEASPESASACSKATLVLDVVVPRRSAQAPNAEHRNIAQKSIRLMSCSSEMVGYHRR